MYIALYELKQHLPEYYAVINFESFCKAFYDEDKQCYLPIKLITLLIEGYDISLANARAVELNLSPPQATINEKHSRKKHPKKEVRQPLHDLLASIKALGLSKVQESSAPLINKMVVPIKATKGNVTQTEVRILSIYSRKILNIA